MSYKFKAHVIITGQIHCLTGLHIGGTEEGYEIGGMDNPILKDKITGFPYIPGSSIKGKMRSSMEWMLGKVDEKGNIHVCSDPKCQVCRIFGTSSVDRRGEEGAAGPTRLIVRDAHLSEETLKDERYVKDKVFITEIKTENSLNRITSAVNPRPMERVPKGAKFDFEMIYGIYTLGDDRGETDIENLQQLSMALQMLEAGGLGGGGSRGSGQIGLESPKATLKRLEDYQKQAESGEVQGKTFEEETISDLIAKVQAELNVSQYEFCKIG